MADNIDARGPSNFPMRPLNKGMIRNLPTNMMPVGSFLRLQNYRVHPYGLKKRGGLQTFYANLTDNSYDEFNERLEHLIYFYRKNAEPETVLLTQTRAYSASSVDHMAPYRISSNVTVLSNGTGSAGDSISIDVSATAAIYSLTKQNDVIATTDFATIYGNVEIKSSFSVDHFTMQVQLTTDLTVDLTGQTLTIDHLMGTRKSLNISYAVLPYTEASAASEEKMIIADQQDRGLYELTKETGLKITTLYDTIDRTNPAYMLSADGVTYFKDRLWAFNCYEDDGNKYSQRIRWSLPGSFDVFRTEDYLDLPYSAGEIIALVPLGSMLIAYFTDAIYIGRQSQVIDLPYVFERIEVGNAGLVNQKAVMPWIDGHFFVGQDNIYFLSGSAGLQDIGSSVLEDTLDITRERNLLDKIQVEHDPITNTMAFFFPEKDDQTHVGVESYATKIWRWNYRSTAWSYDEVSFGNTDKTIPNYFFTSLLSSRIYILNKTWQTFIDESVSQDPDVENDGAVWIREVPLHDSIGTGFAFSDYQSWNALSDDVYKWKKLYYGVYHQSQDQKQMIVEEFYDGDQDIIGETEYPIWCLIESPDIDLSRPDIDKVFTRISAKSFSLLTDTSAPLSDLRVTFSLYLSTSYGYDWKRPKILRFRDNYNEGKADFRATGSTLRFKLINSQVISPYKLSEFVLRGIERGLQIRT